jgi:DNA-binding NarL/FixJ family response regulator
MTHDGPVGRRVLVVDDHEIVGAGLRTLLGRQDWVARCLVATDGGTAAELARRYDPHVALVDVFIGAESGLDVCAALREQSPQMRIALMSGLGRVSRPVALATGARGFFLKDWPADCIVEALRHVSEGRTVFPRPSEAAPAHPLSSRELDVLQQLVRGLSNREVASVLYLSRHTVKQHTSSMYRKLGVRNRTEAASRARLLGLVQ